MTSLRRVFLITLVVLSVPLGLYFLYAIRGIVILALIAIVFATAIRPLVLQLGRRGFSPGAAILIVYAAIFLVLLALALVVIPPFVVQAARLIGNMPLVVAFVDAQIRALQDVAGGIPFLPDLTSSVDQLVSQLPILAAGVLQLTFTLVWAVAGAFLVLVVAFYWLSERDGILRIFLSVLDPQARPKVQSIIDEIEIKLGAFVRGQLLLGGVVGILAFTGLTILDIDYAVVLAIIAGITEMLPIIGPTLGAVPAIIIALLKSPLHGLLALILYVIIQQIENNILVPKVMEKAVGMSPLTVLLALLIGGTLLGIIGALLAVPIAAVIHVVIRKTILDVRPPESSPAGPERQDAAGLE